MRDTDKHYRVEVTTTTIFCHDVEARGPKDAITRLRKRLERTPKLVEEGFHSTLYTPTIEAYQVRQYHPEHLSQILADWEDEWREDRVPGRGATRSSHRCLP